MGFICVPSSHRNPISHPYLRHLSQPCVVCAIENNRTGCLRVQCCMLVCFWVLVAHVLSLWVKCFHGELRGAAVTASHPALNIFHIERVPVDTNQYMPKCQQLGTLCLTSGCSQTTFHSPCAKTDPIRSKSQADCWVIASPRKHPALKCAC